MKKFGKFLKGAYLGIVVLFMYLPIAVMLVMSFTDSRSAAIWNGFSFGAYTALFSDGDVMDALLTTLLVAVISSILATVICTAKAIGLHSMKKRTRAVVESITQLAMVNPDLVTGISMMLLFAFIGIKQNVGITRMVIAHITFNIPYVIFSVLPKLRQSSDSLYEAAMDLGCSPVKALAKVVIPDIMPGIVSGLLLAFTLSINDFAISHFKNGKGRRSHKILRAFGIDVRGWRYAASDCKSAQHSTGEGSRTAAAESCTEKLNPGAAQPLFCGQRQQPVKSIGYFAEKNKT